MFYFLFKFKVIKSIHLKTRVTRRAFSKIDMTAQERYAVIEDIPMAYTLYTVLSSNIISSNISLVPISRYLNEVTEALNNPQVLNQNIVDKMFYFYME